MSTRRILLACLGLAISIGPAGRALAAPAVDTEMAARVELGVDSNPLRISGDGQNGLFTQLRVDGAVDWQVQPDIVLFADGDARQRLHESDVARADHASGTLRAGVSLRPSWIADRRLTLVLGGAYGIRRGTYTDRFTGDVYQAETDPGSGLPPLLAVPDRFDYDTSGVFARARYRLNRRILLSLDTTYDENSYVEDYSTETVLDNLDNREVTLVPGVRIDVNDRIAVLVAYERSDVDYRERPSVDETGVAIAGTTREYRSADYRVTLQLAPADRWKLRAGVETTDRQDVFAGYYDYGSRTSFASVERTVGADGHVQLYGSWSALDYERALVSVAAEDQLRGNEVRRTVARFDHGLRPRLRWYTEVGGQRVDSRDVEFAYDRDWVLTGIEYRR